MKSRKDIKYFNHNGYLCEICKSKFKSFSWRIEKHFIKKHNNSQIILKRLTK